MQRPFTRQGCGEQQKTFCLQRFPRDARVNVRYTLCTGCAGGGTAASIFWEWCSDRLPACGKPKTSDRQVAFILPAAVSTNAIAAMPAMHQQRKLPCIIR